jgi:CheY-like chemotaxis protein
MAYTFDGQGFGALLGDAERLFVGAREHEHLLTWLVTLLEEDLRSNTGAEGDTAPAAHAGSRASTPPEFGRSTDLLATVRDLCVAAREQRQLTESILMRLAGEAPDGEQSARARTLVLVVDDSQDNRDLVATVLEASGFRAITATNGLDGLIVAHYARPAVVLMDVTMPVLDGFEAARLLKASEATRHMKVIAHTSAPDLFGGPLMKLFADLLPKPASPDAIVASVQRLVDGAPPTGGTQLPA